MKVHVNIKITGRVQKVGYRYYAQSVALSLGITGFVKNLPDGSVYAEAEGTQENVDKFIEWCRKGPLLAKVENVTFETGKVMNYSSFEIRGY